ncbi:MAG: penicillin-binding transpeptidase domain-containing protein [Clostridia bacterium]|nr:penicillin-binding transpeptidase domain-containing protein [Clostridia bacterium]
MRKAGAKSTIQIRTRVIVIILLICFMGVIADMFYNQIVRGEELSVAAFNQQLKDTPIRAKRGTIYDATGKVLAKSATVWKLAMEPKYFEDNEQREYVAKGLSELLDTDYDKIYKKAQANTYYVDVANNIENELKDKILEFRAEVTDKYSNLANVISLQEDYKRYYPYNSFASSVIGFTGSDGQGLAGLEYQYDSVLSGTNGRILTALDGVGKTEMPYEYEYKVDAQNGNNLVLTIDETVQRIMEKYLKQGLVDNKVYNRGAAIMMNVKTGAIIGMAVEEGFDLNDPFTIADEQKQKEIDSLPEDKQSEKESEYLSQQWRNKAVSDTYYPGSVFKIITSAMALEEGAITLDSTFYCSGAYSPYEGVSPISCHNTAGHGSQIFKQALCNSCNPAFMMIGQAVGAEKFWEYYKAFGYSEKTGIDLPGESEDVFFSSDGTMGPVDLAVSSFGQGFSITPIQMITAISAVVNGGYLMRPYLVSQIVDDDGNIVSTTEPEIKRQVVSSEVSRTLCEILEENAVSGAAKNGYVAGYRVGGKTGTSQKLKDVNEDGVQDYIASFCGFAPADNPQYALLVYYDTPTGDSYYGSTVSAPVFANIMKEVLPYLELEAQYTEEELANMSTTAGAYTGVSVDEAKQTAEQDGFNVIVYGNGDTVLSQIPSGGAEMPQEGTVVLFTDEKSEQDVVTVPDLTGMTISEANRSAAMFNLNLSISGSASSSNCISYSQDIEAGTQVKPGTVITVSFCETDIAD